MGKKKWRRLKNNLIHCKYCHSDFTDEDITIKKAIEECPCKKTGSRCGLETFFVKLPDKKEKIVEEIKHEINRRERDNNIPYHDKESKEQEETIPPILYFFIPDSKTKLKLRMKIK